MSGEGMIAAVRPDPRAVDWVLSRAVVAAVLEARALAIEAQFAPDKVQGHSRKLPTEAELDQAAFTARQLRVLADEFRTGLHDDGAPAQQEES